MVAMGEAAILIVFTIRYARARRDVYGAETAAMSDDPRTMEISDEGVSVRTKSGVESTVPWANFNGVRGRSGCGIPFSTLR